MRPQENDLDLNNLPQEYGKQPLEESSTTTAASMENNITKGTTKKKKKEGKDDSGKVYECRFCSLKFCKSQALGGHMNRHRQERETETLNRARQLVFSSDAVVGTGSHLGLRDLNMSFGGASGQGCFQGVGTDGRLHFGGGPVYPRQLQTATPQTQPPPSQPHHLHSYLYTPPSSQNYQSPYAPQAPPPPPPPPPPPASPMSEYYIGRPQIGSGYAGCFGREVPVNNAAGGRDGRNWTCTGRYGSLPHDTML